jgi:hypothetical protein
MYLTYFWNKYYSWKNFKDFKIECITIYKSVWYLKFMFNFIVLWLIWQILKYDVQNKTILDISISKLNFVKKISWFVKSQLSLH